MLNFLDYIYFYGIKQEFYINHSDKYSTVFSSILSFVTYFLVCFFLIYFGRNIVFKKNPDFNQLEVNYDNPDLINLENENFLFAFAVQDSNYTNYIDPTIYEVEAFYVKISQDKDGICVSDNEGIFSQNSYEFNRKKGSSLCSNLIGGNKIDSRYYKIDNDSYNYIQLLKDHEINKYSYLNLSENDSVSLYAVSYLE